MPIAHRAPIAYTSLLVLSLRTASFHWGQMASEMVARSASGSHAAQHSSSEIMSALTVPLDFIVRRIRNAKEANLLLEVAGGATHVTSLLDLYEGQAVACQVRLHLSKTSRHRHSPVAAPTPKTTPTSTPTPMPTPTLTHTHAHPAPAPTPLHACNFARQHTQVQATLLKTKMRI
eukprot:jgi/Mesen1/9431/ME000618S08825